MSLDNRGWLYPAIAVALGDVPFYNLTPAPAGIHKKLRRAGGGFAEIPLGQEAGYKILVLYNGRICERVTSEGAPLVLVDGVLHTLPGTTTGPVLEPPISELPPEL
jgi:hypothetical protein